MKKRFIFLTALIGLLVSCPSPGNNPNNGPDDPNNPNNPDQKTYIVFDNSQGICAVSVYNDYQRREGDRIAVITAGVSSNPMEWVPGVSVPFYFSYAINLKGVNWFTLDYVPKEIGKDQTAMRIDEGVTTIIPIPKLDETVSSPDALLSGNCYVSIQNNSSFSFQLLRGSSIITPDKASGSVVNSGERALYTVIAGAASPYRLLVGADYVTFPGSIANFEAGSVYCFVYDDNISLINEVEIKLVNVAGTAQNTSGPPAVGAPVIQAEDGLLTLRWTAVERAEQYEVYVNTTPAPPAAPEKTVTGITTVLPGLVNKTAYYVWIKAVNGFGSSDFSPYGMGIPWPSGEVPATPGRPEIIPGINQLTINWEECGGASSYEVFISASSTRSPMPEIITEKTSATINNLQNDVIYYVWVRAINNAGQSGFSVLESGTPKVPTSAPFAPARPALTVGSRELTVSWQAVELAASYEVWLGTTDNSARAEKYGDDISGGVTGTVISGLVNETTYYVWVKAKNVAGASGFSLPANAKPSAFAVVPPAPALPTVTPGSRALAVSWPAVEGALSYEVWTGLTNNPASAEKRGGDVTGATITLGNLVNDTTYYIWIKSKNNKGASGFSPLASGTPSAFAAIPPAPLAAPTVIAGSGQLTVNWQAVEGANSYEVWVGTSINPTQATKSGENVPGLSYVISGLSNGTTYYVWIRAKNTVGTSEFSPTSTGIPSAFNETPRAPAVAPSVSTGDRQINVTWAAVEGATAYEVWTGTSNSSASAAKNGADVTLSLSAEIYGLTNGTTYYVWIKAKNNVGTSGFSPVASGKPIADGTTPVLSTSNGQISVTWAAIAGADQYDVFCGTGVNPPQTASQTVTDPTITAVISGLVNGTTYNVWVRGRNATGTGAISSASSAKPVGNMGTVTLSSGNGLLTVSWPAVNGADQYDVYYNTGNTIPASPVQTINAPATTAAISDLSNGTTYYVWVKPKNLRGAGNTNAAVSGTPMATPGNLTVSAGNQQITVSWATVPGASGYEIYYGTTATIPVAASFTNVTEPGKTITGLSNGITYNFWVKAVNANGTSGASPMASGKPIGNMGAVTLALGNEQLSLSWDPVAGADQYEVYYSTSSTIPGTPAQTVSTNTVTISSLTNGTTYYFWVKPKNSGGAGAVSAVVNAKPLGTPGAPTVSPAYKQLLVTWTAVTGADEYEVYYGTSSTPTTLATTTAGTTATITGLTGGITYNVRLRAKNANGVSAYGPSASGMPDNIRRPGLYRGTEKIGNQNLADSLTWISANMVTDDDFYIVLGADESASPKTLNYSGKTVGITLMGYGSERSITLNANGALFTINAGVTLTLDENITLVGLSTNAYSLVYVYGTFTMNGGEISGNTGGGVYVDGGTFTMSGGEISGNTAYSYGGGVYIGSSGTFTMSGNAVISGNTASYGGGVYVDGSGTFTKSGGGTITGYASDTVNGNVVKNSSGVVQSNRGHAVYVNSSPTKRRETTAGPTVNLDSRVSGSAGGWE